MINIENVRRYCSNYEQIENYQEAISSQEIWDCHHRNEIDMNLSKKELKERGMYWHRPPEELIFLTVKDHRSLHKTGNKNWLGKSHTDDTKRKMSEVRKGDKNYNFINFDVAFAWDLKNYQGLSYSEISKTIFNIYNIKIGRHAIRRRILMIP